MSNFVSVRAADIGVVRDVSPGGMHLYRFSLDPGVNAGEFDTFEFVATSNGKFNQTENSLVFGDSDDSGFFVLLTAPQNFGGQGLVAFSVGPDTDTPSVVSGAFTSLGDNAASEQGVYPIAQLVVSDMLDLAGSFTVSFFDDGTQVGSVSGPLTMPGDYDGDRVVGGQDVVIWQRDLGAAGNALRSDGDSSGLVDATDLIIWGAAYGQPIDSVAASIPEPDAAALWLAAVACCACRRR